MFVSGPQGLVDAALGVLVEARGRAAKGVGELLDTDAKRRLDVAITATHTVLEPPSLPTDELRAMGLWWEDAEATAGGSVTLTAPEAKAVFDYIQGDSHMIGDGVLDAIMAKVTPEGY